MSDETSVNTLSRALDQATRLIASVSDDQLDDPTPCHDWNVRDLVTHLSAAPRNFITMAQGGDVDWSAELPLPDEPAQTFRENADELLRVVRDAPDTIGIQIPEFAVHSWDLAHAIDRTELLDPDVSELALQTLTSTLKPEMRGSVFGPEVEVSADLPVHDRLAAFAGRDPRA
jgi:uncharacterized protein (TIGR03086 family)